MKKTTLFPWALIAITVAATQASHAGSAVAMEPRHANLTTAYGGPVEREKARALSNARRLYGNDVRIIAATDVIGYGAIAVARWKDRFVVGVVLGKRSATEANTLAIERCLKAGGINPQVKWAWRG
jgi:hypothetical protein